EAEHVARDRGEGLAAGELARDITFHPGDLRFARGHLARPGVERAMQLREQIGAVISLASEHDAVAPGERVEHHARQAQASVDHDRQSRDRKSTRLNSSHRTISYA